MINIKKADLDFYLLTIILIIITLISYFSGLNDGKIDICENQGGKLIRIDNSLKCINFSLNIYNICYNNAINDYVFYNFTKINIRN